MASRFLYALPLRPGKETSKAPPRADSTSPSTQLSGVEHVMSTMYITEQSPATNPRRHSSAGYTSCSQGELGEHYLHHILVCGHVVRTRGFEECGTNCQAGYDAGPKKSRLVSAPFLCPHPECVKERRSLSHSQNIFISKPAVRLQPRQCLLSKARSGKDAETRRLILTAESQPDWYLEQTTQHRAASQVKEDPDITELTRAYQKMYDDGPAGTLLNYNDSDLEAQLANNPSQDENEDEKVDADGYAAYSRSRIYDHLEEDHRQEYCICKSTRDENMYHCNGCGTLYHRGCVGSGLYDARLYIESDKGISAELHEDDQRALVDISACFYCDGCILLSYPDATLADIQRYRGQQTKKH